MQIGRDGAQFGILNLSLFHLKKEDVVCCFYGCYLLGNRNFMSAPRLKVDSEPNPSSLDSVLGVFFRFRLN